MPYENEHAARLQSPGKYTRVRRENDKFAPGVDAIWGVTEDRKVELQAVRFDKDRYTPEQARKWLADHDMKPTEFEAATGPDEKKDATCQTCGRLVAPEALYEDGDEKALCALCAVKARGKRRRKPKKGGVHILGTSRTGGVALSSGKATASTRGGAAEVKAGRRVRGARVEQVRQVLEAFQALGEEITDLLSWADYADAEPENAASEDIVLTVPEGGEEELMGVNLKKVRGLAADLARALEDEKEEEDEEEEEAAESPEAKAAAGREALKKRLMGIVGNLSKDDCDMEACTGQIMSLASELKPKEPAAKTADVGAQGAGDAVPSPGDGAPAPDAVNKAAEPAPLTTAIKAISQDDKGVTVGGYLLLFGDAQHKDLGGDYFTPQTKLWLEQYAAAPCLFHHGLDPKVGAEVMGHRVEAKADEKGVWVKDWLDKSKKYWEFVKPLLEQEKLFYSPGSAPHLVERKSDGELKSFACIEDTMTPVPMQHRLRPLEEIRAAYKGAGLDLPADLSEATGAQAAPTVDVAQWVDEQELSLLAEE